jgi:hypothetical protein
MRMRLSGWAWLTVAICFGQLGCRFGQINPVQDDDRSSHSVKFIQVDKDVLLEVLDWGGSGQPLVLLAGGNTTAHIYDTLCVGHQRGRRGYGSLSGRGECMAWLSGRSGRQHDHA